LAAGHYKQTQVCHIVAAIINIVVSVAAVSVWGLVGIAIGTLVAFAYQTVWMMIYNYKKLLKWSLSKIVKQLIADIVAALFIYLATYKIELSELTYLSWFITALIVSSIAIIITAAVVCLFYGTQFKKYITEKHMLSGE
jgi:peptidoglycan biosynthesis protein MviN/MurJ (putative lipid II flippase)